ncbi:hypothetical protein CONLIGDRAFT_217288 [Coniochaeta ligniaria NRRL 30616]|uniref:SNTX MACPF/CDC-like domain-containing protein n=1 Tax=Coniochaeta ligniaria NRRL 30616 TaxID=1408157 RepID=A0A1J7IYF3_9PEZI|nr:hypothetical protein CONLIGDRAFT_217288 [Coniochaeta ligniaria NRRL 30616]
MEEGEIQVQALGRSPFLGQLYSASTGTLFNVALFPEHVLAGSVTISTPMPRTEVVFTVVRNSKERAHLLDVSASVSLSILGGLVELKGFGKYLDSTDSSEESTTISAVVRCRTVHKRLDLADVGLKSSTVVSPGLLRSLGATHVVTAITYGGTLLANLSESRSQARSNRHIDGDFSLSVMQSLGKLAGAEGSAKLTSDERKQLKDYSFKTSLVADYVNYEDKAPVTPEDMISTIEKGLPKFTSDVGDLGTEKTHGVPVDLVMTPLTYFDQISTEIIFRELAETDLVILRAFYDELSILNKRWRSLLLEVEATPDGESTPYKDLFPSFHEACVERSEAVQHLFLSSRTRMSEFLRDYRTQTNASETAASFLLDAKPEYDSEGDQLDKDTDHWQSLLRLKHTAEANNYPLATIQVITNAMNREKPDSIILHLIPASVGISGLLSAYRELGDDVRKWRELMNAGGGITVYLSLYADPLRDPSLLRLENADGSISHALSMARETSNPACLMFGYRSDRNQRSWMALNHEHWGVVVEPVAKTRYVGFLKDGLPYGPGTMTYPNGFSYTGDWLLGKRDGNGVLRRGDRLLEEGPFIDDKPAQSGQSLQMIPEEERTVSMHTVPVEVTIYRGGDSIASAIFAVPIGPPPHRQVEKIARAFGWKNGERYRLTPTLVVDNIAGVPSGRVKSPFSVVANGPAIESGPYPEERYGWSWPDERVHWNGEEESIQSFNRRFYPFPPPVEPDPAHPTEPALLSQRTRPIKIEALLLS